MQTLYFALVLFLLLNLGAGMWRILRGRNLKATPDHRTHAGRAILMAYVFILEGIKPIKIQVSPRS